MATPNSSRDLQKLWDSGKKEKADLARQRKAQIAKTGNGPTPSAKVDEILAENKRLKARLVKQQVALDQIKGVAVHMSTISRRVNSAAPKQISDWAFDILGHINNTKR